MKRFAIPFVLLVLYFSCGNKKTQDRTGVLQSVVTHEVLHNATGATVWAGSGNHQSLIIGTDNDAEGALYAYNLNGDIVKKSAMLGFPQNPVVIEDVRLNGVVTDAVVTVEAQSGKVRIFSLPDFTLLDNGGIEVFQDSEEAVAGAVTVWERPSDKAIFVTVANIATAKDCLWQYRLLTNSKGFSLSFIRKFGMADGSIQSMVVNNATGYLYCADALGIKQYAIDPALAKNDVLSKRSCNTTGNLVVHTKGSNTCLLASDEERTAIFSLNVKDGSITDVNTIEQKLTVTASCNASVDSYDKGIVVGLNKDMGFCCYKKQDIDKYIKF